MNCHDGGKGLSSDLVEGKEFAIMGMGKKCLAEVVTVCIEHPLGGTAIAPTARRCRICSPLCKPWQSNRRSSRKLKKTSGHRGLVVSPRRRTQV